MSVHFRRQIEKLKGMVLKLGGLVEEAVERAVRAVDTRDKPLAQSVIDGDVAIDLMEVEVEEECLHTLALHQPVALDLRFVASVLKINNDLERIADLAVNIAEQAAFLAQEHQIQIPCEIFSEAEKVLHMLKASLDSLVNLDMRLAEEVCRMDDDVDSIHRQMYHWVTQGIQKHPEAAEQHIHVLAISRQLERIADHAVNIAEDVLYTVRGEIQRHRKRPESSGKSDVAADA